MPPSVADKVAGVRIVRRNGNYRQDWSTENQNRRLRTEEAPIIVSHADDNSNAEAPTDGRLKVITQREFSPNVPFEMQDGKFSYDDAPNPVNQMGPLLADNVPVVTSNDFESFLAAFNKRSNFVQLKGDDIDDDVFQEALQIWDELPDDMFPEWNETPEAVDEWLAGFAPDKQARMRAAEEGIAWCDANYLGTKDLSVKQEVLLKRNDPKWAARIIYAGNDHFNRVTGPAAKAVMSRLMDVLEKHKLGEVEVKLAYKTDDINLCRFLAGDEPLDRATPSFSQNQPELTTTVEGDFSANDREQRSRTALIFDKALEKLCFPVWLRNLLLELEKFTVHNRRFGVSAHLKYQLPTGTTFTTSRNSVYNGTMFAVSTRRQKIPYARACILGDDILARLCAAFCLSLWKSVVDKFKMVLKGKAPRLNGQATLLSRRLIFNTETPCMIPLIGKAIARFNARASNNAQVTDSAYMAGKALSYAYEFRHVPFMRDFFLQRYDSEDNAAVSVDELTWFSRSSGIKTVQQLERLIRNEHHLVSDEVFLEWLMEVYEMGLCDLEEIMESTVLRNDISLFSHPSIDLLAIDW